MAKCRNCVNTVPCVDLEDNEFEWCPEINDNPDLDMDRECDKYKAKTNADRIRAMSDLELSNFIKSVHNDGTCREYAVAHGLAFTDMFGNKGVLAWLQSEAE